MEFIVFWVSVGPLTATNGARVRIIIDRDYLRGEEQTQIGERRREHETEDQGIERLSLTEDPSLCN